MKSFLSCCLALVFSMSVFAQPEPLNDAESHAALMRTLTFYFEGVNLHEIPALEKAYHPEAQFTYVDTRTGACQTFGLDHYLEAFRNDPPDMNERELKLKAIDVSGNVAMVKTQIYFLEKGLRINDYLSLMLLEGAWKIVSRTSHKEFARFDAYGMAETEQAYLDHRAIGSLLKTYLEAGDELDAEAICENFLPAAEMRYVDPRHGTFQRVSLEGYPASLDQLPQQQYKRSHEVLSVDLTGNTAVAKVRIRYKRLKTHVVEYLSLVKVEGAWTIAHKVVHRDKRALVVPV